MAHGPHECPPFDSLSSLYFPRFLSIFPLYIFSSISPSLPILNFSTPVSYFASFGALDQ